MKVALVHEFLTQLGGAERVLQALHEIFPEALIYTLVYDPERTGGVFKTRDIRTSFLQKLPGMPKNYKYYLPLMPKAIESFDFTGFDLVLSDSSAFAKGVKTKKPTVHICYCHTPTRYLWEVMDEYLSGTKYNFILKTLAKLYLELRLKRWDIKAAQRPDKFIANSQTVKDRIKKYYHRDAEVIYPPVDTEFFKPSPPAPLPQAGEGGQGPGEGYFFTASRLEPYKKIDLVVEAFNQLNLPLKVAGSGSQILNLKSKIINPKIEFFGRVTDEELRKLYQGARAFVFPALEDAGIMVLESLACGIPVITLNKGGAAEFIQDEVNGILFKQQTSEAIVAAVKRFDVLTFDSERIRSSVSPFDKAVFKSKIRKLVEISTSSR